jgi:hypothetical protein
MRRGWMPWSGRCHGEGDTPAIHSLSFNHRRLRPVEDLSDRLIRSDRARTVRMLAGQAGGRALALGCQRMWRGSMRDIVPRGDTALRFACACPHCGVTLRRHGRECGSLSFGSSQRFVQPGRRSPSGRTLKNRLNCCATFFRPTHSPAFPGGTPERVHLLGGTARTV